MQDPVAEPRAAGIQTLWKERGRNAPLIQNRSKTLLTRRHPCPSQPPGKEEKGHPRGMKDTLPGGLSPKLK